MNTRDWTITYIRNDVMSSTDFHGYRDIQSVLDAFENNVFGAIVVQISMHKVHELLH